MKTTRRGFLAACVSPALAGALVWDSGRIGFHCLLTPADETAARRMLDAVRATGCTGIQVNFWWDEASTSFLKGLPGWVRSAGLRADAVSAYVNCCDPESVMMHCRREDFLKAFDLASALSSRILVAWTGGFGKTLRAADPRNFTPQAMEAVERFAGEHVPRLKAAGLTLALESFYTLACPDAENLRQLLDRLPTCIGAVLDPPNLTAPARFQERDRILRDMVAKLHDRIAVVHLKDFRLKPDGSDYDLPGPLEGEMNYRLFADLIRSLPSTIPLIAEHLPVGQLAAAKRRIDSLFKEAA